MSAKISVKKMLSSYYPYIILGLGALLLLCKCFYSFCWSDETFYFSTAYRFYQGDSIFLHEWFPTQLSALILLPLFSLYMAVTGSTTGILLFFRICFVIFASVSSLVTYQILKNTVKKTTALFCAITVLFYTHLNIATLSYYTISVHCFLLAMLLIYHYYQNPKKRFLLISGILFALCVLALPTMAVAYFLVIAAILLLLLICRVVKLPAALKETIAKADLKSVCFYTFLGICIPAVIFFAFMLTNVSITDFINGIPYVLSDEEHETSLIYPLKKFFIGINEVYGYAAYAGYLLIVITLFFGRFFSEFLRKVAFSCDFILFLVYFACSLGHTGYIQTALCMTALPLFFLTKKKNWSLFFLLFGGGMIFSVVYSYSSNGYLYILSIGHFIASIAAILFVQGFALEQGMESNPDLYKRLCQVLCMVIICVTVLQTITLRIVNIYRDAPLSDLTAKITEGPASGLYTTTEHLSMYQTVYDTLMTYCQSDSFDGNYKNQTIFITKLLPYGYMCTDLRCAAPTTWRTAFNSKRLEPYYKMNPERFPDIILVLDEQYGSYNTCGDIEADPTPNANEIEGYLRDYVEANSYDKISVPCGVLYQRPAQ